MTTLHDVALLRLAAQRLIGPGSSTAAETVRWMTATQAQDHTGALTSVALRTSAATRADVEAALDAGAIVKCWPMRGTLHLVAAEDLPWMLALLAPRVVASSTARRAGLGLTEPQLEQARDLTLAALAGGRRLRRADLLTAALLPQPRPRHRRRLHPLGQPHRRGRPDRARARPSAAHQPPVHM